MADKYIISFTEDTPPHGNVHELTAELEGHDRQVVEDFLQGLVDEDIIVTFDIYLVEDTPTMGESDTIAAIEESLSLEGEEGEDE